jgi:penicillin-binding protein 1A
MFAYLRNMGISTIVDGQDGPAVSLGGMNRGVHLIELAGAYGMVANEGMFNRPVLYTMVLDHEGGILLENPVNPTRVFRDTAAYMLLDTMKDTMTLGTGPAGNWVNTQLRRDIPIAGKTGTSQNRRDLGFSGSTPYLTASIWMGNDNNDRLTSGANRVHLVAWRSIMEEIHEGLPPRQFTRPPDNRFATATICSDSGLLAGEFCHLDSRGNRARSALMDAHHVPTGRCDIHVQFTYCVLHGYLAGPNCHPDYISTRVGVNMPDVYGGFPQGVLDGIMCTHCELLDYLPWDVPDESTPGETDPASDPWMPPFPDSGLTLPPPPPSGGDTADHTQPPPEIPPDVFIPDAPPDPTPGQAPGADLLPDHNPPADPAPSDPDDEEADDTPYGL